MRALLRRAVTGSARVVVTLGVAIVALSAPLVAGLAGDGRWPTSPADPLQCGLYDGPPYGPMDDYDAINHRSACGEEEDDALWMMQKKQGYKLGFVESLAQAHSAQPAPPRRRTGVSAASPRAAGAAEAAAGRSPFAPSRCPSPAQAAEGSWAQLDVLAAADWEWPLGRAVGFVDAAAGYFCTLPAILVYGLVWAIGGSGSIQILSTLAFWVLVRPAGAALEALWLYSLQCPGAPVRLAACYATAAHFYWAWGAVEIATRRRPLLHRLALLLALSIMLLPIPLAQAWLGDRSPGQLASGAVVGQLLGIAFFFGLRWTGVWTLLRAHAAKEWPVTTYGVAAHWLKPWDNLTSFCGGSVWPSEPPLMPLKVARPKGVYTSEPVRPG